ncbi:hypothetical protein P3W85_45195 [Cupriavidus basilensis]|uniref:Restriction endonuclease n=1 Tax=Cupriavidus basilensis TaxID=68895 RepID=A0ABT6B642_9BURK|nr:hypothetical protein [Cupriavidus basilensis]MDF3840072.1 hypothetical protein [Cupriavidus basilensis]
MSKETTCFDVFEKCVTAIQAAELIESESDNDKEFHFQNWVEQRLKTLSFNFDPPKRHSYPDFRIVQFTEGYEVKGLKTPGRDKNFDSNSQAPSGFHNGRDVFYVFGRYPKKITSYPKSERGYRQYPVIDLVICHGDFLSLDRDYVHENKHIKGFGSYGDIMIRDRKMYVAPTPFALTEGTTGLLTLILPDSYVPDERFQTVGHLARKEAEELVVSYSFDLQTNEILTSRVKNPKAGTEHKFVAYRLKTQNNKPVKMISQNQIFAEMELAQREAEK